MAHMHEHSDTYYLDQLCLIALSAAFGGVCLTLYFLNTNMLQLMLGSQFHDLVALSGFVLVGLAVTRGVILWRQVGKLKAAGAHVHAHDHEGCCDHEHDHAHGVVPLEQHVHSHGGVAHSHEQPPALAAAHTHSHEHTHAHGHDHEHDQADHDHGWAPWRYVVLLLPVFLFMLGLPNKPPRARATNVDINPTEMIAGYSGLVGEAYDPLGGLLLTLSLYQGATPTETPKGVHFKRLQNAPFEAPDLEGTWVRVKGQFAPSRRSDRVFTLARFRIQCCASDAVQLNVPVVCREPVQSFKGGDWIEVTARVEFQPSERGSKMTVLKVSKRDYIQPTTADPDPWVQ